MKSCLVCTVLSFVSVHFLILFIVQCLFRYSHYSLIHQDGLSLCIGIDATEINYCKSIIVTVIIEGNCTESDSWLVSCIASENYTVNTSFAAVYSSYT